MNIEKIAGHTRVLAEDQEEFNALAIRDAVEEYQTTTGQKYSAPSMTSAWRPTPEELTCLLNGGCVYLRILGTQHPPVMLWAE